MKPFQRLENQLVAILRNHLATGRPAIVPDAGAILWGAFCDLSASRTMGYSAPNPISYAEIEAWARLHRWPLQSHHVAILRALDNAFVSWATSGGRPTIPRSSGQAVSPTAFDAVFG